MIAAASEMVKNILKQRLCRDGVVDQFRYMEGRGVRRGLVKINNSNELVVSCLKHLIPKPECRQ